MARRRGNGRRRKRFSTKSKVRQEIYYDIKQPLWGPGDINGIRLRGHSQKRYFCVGEVAQARVMATCMPTLPDHQAHCGTILPHE